MRIPHSLLNKMGKPKIGVIDVPFAKGQRKHGVQKGPKVLRDAELLQKLKEHCRADIKDYGCVEYKPSSAPTTTNLLNFGEVAACNKQLAKMTETVMKDGRTCLSLGGDHSIAFGSISGHCKAKNGNVAVIWVDAHADINTDATSDTGSMHGMPVALLAKEIEGYWKSRPKFDWHKPCISLKNVGYIGLRSIDPYEEFFISKYGITVYDMDHIQNMGIQSVIDNVLKKIDPDNNRSLHLSFDIDAIDPQFAGSTGTPVPGGLLVREGISIANALHKTGRLDGMDMVEVNPNLGCENLQKKTITTAVEIILAAFGSRKRGFPSDMPPLLPSTSG
nr:arginase-1-like isoform X1 [Onthophagus taurus]